MRSWVRISRDAVVGGIIFFKAGRTFSPGSRLVLPTGTKGPPLVPVPDPGLKDPPFSPGCFLPGGEPGLEGVLHRE